MLRLLTSHLLVDVLIMLSPLEIYNLGASWGKDLSKTNLLTPVESFNFISTVELFN